jgi:head-tail adaptor
MNIAHFLTETLTQERKTRTSNGKGGFTETYHSIGTVNGRINDAGGSEVHVAKQRKAEVSHIVYLDPDTDVKMGDRFIDSRGRVLRVTIPHAEIPSVPIYSKSFLIETQH